jgi:hypothetical protein
MNTAITLLHHTLMIAVSNLRRAIDPAADYRSEIVRLTRERDIETQRANGLDKLIGRHLAESVVMLSEIEKLEKRNAYLEASAKYRREVLAGAMLTRNMIDVNAKMMEFTGRDKP